MGTRGAWGFRINGEDKVTYNHWDSYPEGLGQDIVNALRKIPLDNLRERAANLRLVNGQDQADAGDIERLKKFADDSVSSRSMTEWYVLLRKTQGDLPATLEAGVMIDGKGFVADSLFCEWAYLVNLDEGVLEVFQGFQREPHQKGRFANMESEKTHRGENQYYPVAWIASFDLNNLPENLLQSLNLPEE